MSVGAAPSNECWTQQAWLDECRGIMVQTTHLPTREDWWCGRGSTTDLHKKILREKCREIEREE